jgi:molybdopterin-guanine dinucleotide biosynthesis protein A
MSQTQFEGRLANVSAAVLLGGASTRMGEDKAHLEFGGVPFASLLAQRLARISDDVMLVGGAPPEDALGRRVPDAAGTPSALLGLVTALEAARCERVIVLSTDVPLISPALLYALSALPEADAIVPRADGFTHPLCALYRRDSVLAVASQHLAVEQLSLSSVLDAVETRYLEGEALAALDLSGMAFTNVNTPDDYAALSRLVGEPTLFA